MPLPQVSHMTVLNCNRDALLTSCRLHCAQLKYDEAVRLCDPCAGAVKAQLAGAKPEDVGKTAEEKEYEEREARRKAFLEKKRQERGDA